METGTFVFLVALPIVIAAIAASLNSASASKYWSAAGVIAVGWGIVSSIVLSRPSTRADFVNWILLCALPIATTFLVARWQRMRGRRLIATCVALVSYLIALLIGLNIGLIVGVLKE
jgi:hypothetical protein